MAMAPSASVVSFSARPSAALRPRAEEEKTFVGLTEEKARQLRARMSEMESFHDAMYHSAIASRLARST
ncbi:unnamed protein product [Triticum turgidum subsp. durum]|uniref:Uncharacterized protein n=1 Tax=Triticum turgidum subsp. durum TaxID=4567 RepID=A0A9R0V554_TRITD|nr:unnamed protein product [Triticum turgidum subsp. durum]